jgi:outer membrane protein OmpA-like peptidoglycan-associated protein
LSYAERIIGIALIASAFGGAVAAWRGDLEWLLSNDAGANFLTTQKPPPAARVGAPDAGAPADSAKRGRPAAAGDQAPRVAAPASPHPTFDVIRIDPDGTSVFAGRGPPLAQLHILANGVPMTTVRSNADGQWATTLEHRFAAGDYEFALAYRTGEGDPIPVGQRVAMHLIGGKTPPLAAAAARPQPRPSPIMFIYNEANFTDQGRAQAAALANYFKEQNIAAATLSGHADERGSDPYNLHLSQERLDAVVRFLRAEGFAGRLVLVPMGKREPFAGTDRRRLSPEETFALDRRVELRAAQ